MEVFKSNNDHLQLSTKSHSNNSLCKENKGHVTASNQTGEFKQSLSLGSSSSESQSGFVNKLKKSPEASHKASDGKKSVKG